MYWKFRLLLLFSLALAMPHGTQATETTIAPFALSGQVGVTRVTDGDSLRSGRLKIRLFGIDAPELKQQCETDDGSSWSCGLAARDAMRRPAAADSPNKSLKSFALGTGSLRCANGARHAAADAQSPAGEQHRIRPSAAARAKDLTCTPPRRTRRGPRRRRGAPARRGAPTAAARPGASVGEASGPRATPRDCAIWATRAT